MKHIIIFLFLTSLFSCNSSNEKADGYGNFEATEITISAEANGKLEYLNLEEGDLVEPNTLVGLVDTIQLHLNKQQLVASKTTVYSKS
jgi:HlyD family secretion protein